MQATYEHNHTVLGDTWQGNGKLGKPVGLLTADEAAYAGGPNRDRNVTYYLYTDNSY